jgi:neutral ceramidase
MRIYYWKVAVLILLAVSSAGTSYALDAGAASADITPDVKAYKVPMAGYGARMGKPSTGVHDPLHAKVLYLRDNDSALAIITCDLRSVTLELKQLIIQKAGIVGLTEDNVMLCASHTHSGPSIFREKFWQLQFGVFDPAILEPMSSAVADALKKAVASAVPARVGFASEKVEGFTENRRWEYDTDARTKAGETPAMSPMLSVLRVDNADKKPLAIFVHYATHPTILPASNMLLSADWPGVMQARIEEGFPGAVAMYANGAEGDQAPHGEKGDGEFDRVADFGTRLAAEAVRLSRSIETMPDSHVDAVRTAPALPEIVFSPGALNGPRKDMGPFAIEALPRKAEIQAFAINGVAMVTVPGEPICEVGLDATKRVEALGFKHAIVIGLANDYIGYVVNEKEYAHAGYEVDSRSYYGPGLGTFIAENAAKAASRLKK